MNHSNFPTQLPGPQANWMSFRPRLPALLMRSRRSQHLHVPQSVPDVVPLPPTHHPGLPGQGPDGPSPPPPPEMPPGMPPEVPPDQTPPEINDPVLPGEHSPIHDPVASDPYRRPEPLRGSP